MRFRQHCFIRKVVPWVQEELKTIMACKVSNLLINQLKSFKYSNVYLPQASLKKNKDRSDNYLEYT